MVTVTEKVLMPTLRFSEFKEPWEAHKVSQLTIRFVNPVAVDSVGEYREIGIRSHGKGLFHKQKIAGSVLGNKRVFWVKPNCFIVNIVFAWEQAIAKTTEAELGFIASHRFPMYEPLVGKANVDFLVYFFKRKKGKNILELASPGGAGRNKTLGQKEFEKTKLIVPKVIEQQKIANFLTLVDTKIQQLKRKQTLMQQYKKGLMKQLFSRQLRFKDDDEMGYPDWDDGTLGEVAENIMYGMNAASKKFDGKNKYLRITDIDEVTRQFKDKSLTSPNGDLEKKYRLNKGDVVFARTGASVGKSYLHDSTDDVVYFAGFLIRFSITKSFPYFIFLQTHTSEYQRWVKIMSMRSGQPGINAEEYKRLPIKLPCLAEQKKLAEFLGATDMKAQSLSKQITQAETFKKGLLQQMFV